MPGHRLSSESGGYPGAAHLCKERPGSIVTSPFCPWTAFSNPYPVWALAISDCHRLKLLEGLAWLCLQECLWEDRVFVLFSPTPESEQWWGRGQMSR